MKKDKRYYLSLPYGVIIEYDFDIRTKDNELTSYAYFDIKGLGRCNVNGYGITDKDAFDNLYICFADVIDRCIKSDTDIPEPVLSKTEKKILKELLKNEQLDPKDIREVMVLVRKLINNDNVIKEIN